MTPIMTNEVVEMVDMSHLSVSNYNPKFECPADIPPGLTAAYIFAHWFSGITPAVSMTDPAVLTHFYEYHTYLNSKKCRATRKTKETFPFKGVVNEKKKRIPKNKEAVLDSEGNEIVAEKKKRTNKKKEEDNVEVGSDVEAPVVVEPVVEKKKKRINKKKEEDNVEVGSDVEAPVVVEPVVEKKKKRTNKKKEEDNVEVGSDVEAPVVEKKKKITRISKAVVETETTETDEDIADIADALEEINKMELQELEEED